VELYLLYCGVYIFYVVHCGSETLPVKSFFEPWIKIRESRTSFIFGSRISDPGSVNNIHENFWGQKYLLNVLLTNSNFFLFLFRNKANFVKFMATKKGNTTNFFPSSFLLFDLGSELQDPGSEIQDGNKNQNPGSVINIPDPQQWFFNIRIILVTQIWKYIPYL
jgi:hypothetical protein